LYSQFYSSVKEVFAAGNQYPFTNTAIEMLPGSTAPEDLETCWGWP
jgi:hypothetical protein